MNKRDHQILKIALPAIVTNITVPLLGLVDTAIVGHMGSAAYIGAVAVGSMIFNLIYWVFGFLRMGTSGMTAQARGRRDFSEVSRLLVRSGWVSLTIALLIVVLQWPVRECMLWFIGPSDDVRPLAVTYFNIVVWGAPAMLSLYSLSGWFIGMQNTRIPMFVSIIQNVVNILASLTFVYGLGMKVEGVALGTVVAQYAGCLMALWFLWRYYRKVLRSWRPSSHLSPLTSYFSSNRDIFLRTLCLVAVNLYFTSAGARQGATILAVNTLLMQLYLLFSYILDGFAFAGEALGGKYWGAKDMDAYHDVVRRLFGWGALMTIIFTITYVVGGTLFLRLLTDEPQVVEASQAYVWWAYLIPVAGVAAFIWDGLFIGTTQTRGMLVSSAIAALVFFGTATIAIGIMGNHGLWLAMILFLAVRGIVQTIIVKSEK
ncbi:MAG: MATE family efflux transporter [Prevotella sp.]|nr:MATE family efflux transporter [Prevotella sp.]